MAGHSQFKNIMHRKGRQDKIRSKLFSKLSREITVAAKMGGSDPDANPRLRLAVDKAKAQSMPKDNIERAIKRGTGEIEGDDYVEMTYEGYGPHGVAVFVEALTDNTNRTVADLRHIFSKAGGYMGIGFAIPIELAKSVMGQLIERGRTSRGYLGIRLEPIPPEEQSALERAQPLPESRQDAARKSGIDRASQDLADSIEAAMAELVEQHTVDASARRQALVDRAEALQARLAPPRRRDRPLRQVSSQPIESPRLIPPDAVQPIERVRHLARF